MVMVKINQSGIHIDGWTGEQYTVIVYLTPDMKPEDGGVLSSGHLILQTNKEQWQYKHHMVLMVVTQKT